MFAGLGLGFSLSLLFFMDQNISSAMVNNPGNRYITLIIFFKEGCLEILYSAWCFVYSMGLFSAHHYGNAFISILSLIFCLKEKMIQ